jgi:hypothetical protein
MMDDDTQSLCRVGAPSPTLSSLDYLVLLLVPGTPTLTIITVPVLSVRLQSVDVTQNEFHRRAK